MEELLHKVPRKMLVKAITEMVSAFGERGEQIVHHCLDSAEAGIKDVQVVQSSPVQKTKKLFSMASYRQRQVAFRLQYEGGPYFGFASQCGECDETIEKHLFAALTKLKLVECRQTCNYSRCGRTDRGVSAVGQVISVKLRSSIPIELEGALPAHPCDGFVTSSGAVIKEMDFCSMINRCLPENIRVVGWTEVDPSFNARFSATGRTYRYFFMRQHLNLGAMREAARLLVGDHDFQNFCKIDIGNVTNFRREIYSANIVQFMPGETEEREVWMLEISGVAFLWHMIRCIMSVLFMVGQESELPEIVLWLLDTEKCSAKPAYTMANELPLVLHDCQFDKLDFKMQPQVLWSLTGHYESVMERHLIAAARARNALDVVCQSNVRVNDVHDLSCHLEEKVKRSVKSDGGERAEGRGKKKRDGSHTDSSVLGGGASSPTKRVCSESSIDRGRCEQDEDQPQCNSMTWQHALEDLKALGFHPTASHQLVHVPLRKRHQGQSYSSRVDKLTGIRKERYDRHISMKSEGQVSDPEFFSRMRQLGSIEGGKGPALGSDS